MKVEITEAQINQLLEDVKLEFVALQKSDADALEALKKEFPPKKEEAPADAPAESEAPASETPAEAAPAADEGAPPADDSSPAPDADPAQGGVSPEELHSMYEKLSDEDLAQHYVAASKAMFGRMSGGPESPDMPGAEGGAPDGAPAPDAASEAPAEAAPAADEGAPPADDKPEPPPFGKSEDLMVSDEVIEAFEHLESENKTLKDESEALKKKLDELAETMTKLIAKPVRAGFASGSVIESAPQPIAPLSKSEIVAKLNVKAQDPTLTVVEREQVLKYSMNPVLSDELSKFLETKQGA